MKVSELKLNQEITINGHQYKYKGIQKIRRPNFGKVQQIVFEGKIKGVFDYKYFDLIVGNKDLKVDGDKIEMK